MSWYEDRLLHAQGHQHHPVLLEILTDFASVWDGHLWRINMSRHRILLANEEVKQLHSALCRAKPAARKFSTAEINQMLKERVTRPAATKLVAHIVFPLTKDSSLRFCVDYQKLTVLTVCNS